MVPVVLLEIGLTISSLLLMPALGIAEQRLGDRLSSGATAGEGAQNLLCAYLAGAVLVGLVGNRLWGWWWLDPVAGLLVAAVATPEELATAAHQGHGLLWDFCRRGAGGCCR